MIYIHTFPILIRKSGRDDFSILPRMGNGYRLAILSHDLSEELNRPTNFSIQ